MRKLIYGALALSAAMAVGFGAGAKDAEAAVAKKGPAASDITLDGNQLTIAVDGATTAADTGKVFVGVPKFTKGSGTNSSNSLVSVPSWDEYDYDGSNAIDTNSDGNADVTEVTIDLSAYPNNKDAYLMVKYDTAKDSEATLVKIPKSDAITKAEYVPVTDKTKADEAEILIKNGSAATDVVKNAEVYYYTALQNTTAVNGGAMEADVHATKGSKTGTAPGDGDGKYLFADSNVLKSFENTGASVYFYVEDRTSTTAVTNKDSKVDARVLYMGSYDAGNKFIKAADTADATATTNFVVTGKRPSKAVKTTIPKRSDAPKLTVDYVNGTIKVPAKCEYAFFDQYDKAKAAATPAYVDATRYVAVGATAANADDDASDPTKTHKGRTTIGFSTSPISADRTFKLGYDNATSNQEGLDVYGDFYLDYKGIAKTGKYKDLYTKPARVLFDGLVDTDVASAFDTAVSGSTTTGTIASGASKDEKGEKDSLPITVTLKYNKSKLNYDVVVANHNIDAAYTVRVVTEKLDYAVKTLNAATAQGTGTSRAFKSARTLTVKTIDVRDASDFRFVRVYVQKQGNKKASKWLQREVFVEKDIDPLNDSTANAYQSAYAGISSSTDLSADPKYTNEDNRQQYGVYTVDHTGNSTFDFQVTMQTSGTDAFALPTDTPPTGLTFDGCVKVYFQGIKGDGYKLTATDIVNGSSTANAFNSDNKLVVGSKILISCKAPNDEMENAEKTYLGKLKSFIEDKIQIVEKSTEKAVGISRGVLNDAGDAYVYTITMPADDIVIKKK